MASHDIDRKYIRKVEISILNKKNLFGKWLNHRTGPVPTSAGNLIYALHKTESNQLTKYLSAEYCKAAQIHLLKLKRNLKDTDHLEFLNTIKSKMVNMGKIFYMALEE